MRANTSLVDVHRVDHFEVDLDKIYDQSLTGYGGCLPRLEERGVERAVIAGMRGRTGSGTGGDGSMLAYGVNAILLNLALLLWP